jgi:hypothetical protein
MTGCLVRINTFALGLVGLSYTHKEVAELVEQSSLEGFSHEITNHITGGTPLDGQFLVPNTVRHEEVADVDMCGTLSTGALLFFSRRIALWLSWNRMFLAKL